MEIPRSRHSRPPTKPMEDITPSLGDKLSAGRVLQVYPSKFLASVYIFQGYNQGKTIDCHFRCLQRNYKSRSGVIFVPEENDLVLVDWRFGPTPSISDYYPQISSSENEESVKTSVTPIREMGGEDGVYNAVNTADYRAGPTDLMPGDKIIMGKLGNFLGVLAGGLSILRGGPLSQIILSKLGDAVKIVSRRFELISDFGIVRFKNDNGATSLEILGNDSDVDSNKHTSNWKYSILIGAQRLLDVNLGGVFNFFVERDGSVFFRAKKATIDLENPPKFNFRGAVNTAIGGTASRTIDGDDYKAVAGTVTQKMSKLVTVCSGPKNEVVSAPANIQYQSTYSERIQGTALTSISPIAKETKIAAGNYEISVGNPLDMGIPSATLAGKSGSFNLDVYNGDVNQRIVFKGNHSAYTTLGDIKHQTLAGDCSMNSSLGNVEVSTLSGDASLTTLNGKITASTLLGDVYLGTKVGNTTIEALTGTLKLVAGSAAIELGPTGIKISNGAGSFELLDTLIKLANHLVSAQTPGYGGPLSTAAAIGGEVTVGLMGVKGA